MTLSSYFPNEPSTFFYFTFDGCRTYNHKKSYIYFQKDNITKPE